MRICEVIGSVTLSRVHPSIAGACFRVAVPFTLAELREGGAPRGEELVLYDELGAGSGNRVGVSEGREAAAPFHPDRKPIDAYCACILDNLTLENRSKP